MSFQDAEGIERCQSAFAGPCHCGPGVHVNLERRKGDIAATIVLGSVEDCEGLIKQIRESAETIWGDTCANAATTRVKE